jgi:carbonic anhydrase/acetyltransferase-like protein (isoleucine patch superfamily)
MGVRERKYLKNRLKIDSSAWIAPNAVVVGDVSIGQEASVWFGCVLRGDMEPIVVGDRSNVQDLTLVHVDDDLPTVIGSDTTIGHNCVIHGCEIGNHVLIGMGAVILSGARIGDGALVAAGAVVREGMEVPAGMMVAGVPAKLRGEVTDELRDRIVYGVENYVQYSRRFLSGELGGGPHGG